MVEKAMDQRTSVLDGDAKTIQLIDGIDEEVASYTVGPIVANGDPIGAVVIFQKTSQSAKWNIKRLKLPPAFGPANGTIGLIPFILTFLLKRAGMPKVFFSA